MVLSRGDRAGPVASERLKNIGISFAERGEYGRATDAWIAATYAYPEDERSLGLLEDLLEERPDLERDTPGLGPAVEECRLLVRLAGGRSWEP